jgi:hypothetical protein
MPCCAIRRTVRLEWRAFCFNCRLWWDRPAGTAAAPDQEPIPYPFDSAQLLRLERYRAAIYGGLYTDWPATALELEGLR